MSILRDVAFELIAEAVGPLKNGRLAGHPERAAQAGIAVLRDPALAAEHAGLNRGKRICHRHATATLLARYLARHVLGPGADNGSPFVKTLKRDYVQVTPFPDAQTLLGLIESWIEDYNENHPHSGLKMRSPRQVIAVQTATACVSGEMEASS